MIEKFPLEIIFPNPWQTRAGDPDPEYIKELALDIARNGLIQTPVGRIVDVATGEPINDQDNGWREYDGNPPHEVRIELAAGHNRLAAFKWLFYHSGEYVSEDFHEIPIDLRALDNEAMAVIAWSENERRRDHNPIERAQAIERAIKSFAWSQAVAAERFGLTRSTVTNILRLLKLPDELQSDLLSGRISERQAVAILPLYELPAGALDSPRYYAYRPDDLIKSARSGELSSDEIRSRVTNLIGNLGTNLGHAQFTLDDELAGEGIVSPTCRDCPSRLAARNVCLNPVCLDRKSNLFQYEYLRRAAEAAGLAPLEPDKKGSPIEDFHGWTKQNYIDSIKVTGCENLRIRYLSWSGYDKSALKDLGFEHAEIVCSKRSGFCSCLNGLMMAAELKERQAAQDGSELLEADSMAQDTNIAENSTPELAQEPGEANSAPVADPETLAQLARQARDEKRDAKKKARLIYREFGRKFAEAIEARQARAYKLIGDALSWKLKEIESDDPEIYIRAIGEFIGLSNTPYEPRSLWDISDKLNPMIESFGGEPIDPDHLEPDPAELDTIAEITEIWKRASTWPDSLLEDPPDESELGQMIRELENLDDLVNEIPEDYRGPIASLPAELDDLVKRLQEIEAIMISDHWDPDGFERLETFLNIPAGELDKDSADELPAPVIEYGLALIDGKPALSLHAAAMRARLLKLDETEG